MVKGDGDGRGPGRKPLPASVKRSVLLQFRCQPREERMFSRKAKARRMKLPEWIRATLTKAARPRR